MNTKALAIILVMATLMTGCRLMSSSQVSPAPEIIEQETAIPIATVSQATETIAPIVNEAEPVMAVPQGSEQTPCVISDINLPTYVVNTGDTLTTIAIRHNTAVATLIQMNCLGDADNLQNGQRLYVPLSNQQLIETDYIDPVTLPVLGGNGEPPQEGCFVQRNIGINDVFVHHEGSSITTAKLGSYLPLESVVRNAYLVIVQGYPNNIGWVWQADAHLVGNACGSHNNPPSQPVEPPMIIPEFGNQNEPPTTGCSVIKNPVVETAFIYGTAEAFNTRIGRLRDTSWLPLSERTPNGVSVTLSDGRIAWMSSNDIMLIGTACTTT